MESKKDKNNKMFNVVYVGADKIIKQLKNVAEKLAKVETKLEK